MRGLVNFTVMGVLGLSVGTGCQVWQKEPAEASEAAALNQAEVPEEREELIEAVDEFFSDPEFGHAFWGAKIKSLDDGEVWYSRNEEKLFMPASNEKIPTSASALKFLGPDFRFETELKYRGQVEDGTLVGDLVVRGNGDPTLYERFFDSTTEVFEGWADELKEQGIERIQGDVIGDDNAWEDRHVHWSWPQNLSAWYYAEFGPLTLNENYVDIVIVPPEEPDGEVLLEPNLPSDYYRIENNIRVVEDGRSSVSYSREDGTNIIKLSGRVRAGSDEFMRSPTITNPTLFYVTVLKETLEREGIRVDGAPIDCDEIPNWDQNASEFTSVLTHESPPLRDILQMLMKRSQNMFAETMVMTQGWKATGTGDFNDGRDVVRDQLEEMGVPRGTYQYSDGSGLSRYNLVSPKMIVQINEWMHGSDHWENWYRAFPIAGVDGTLGSRMEDTPAEENVRAKTGTISNVRGLSGYVTTASGELLAFSFLVNAHLLSTSDTNRVTDGALALLAGYEGD